MGVCVPAHGKICVADSRDATHAALDRMRHRLESRARVADATATSTFTMLLRDPDDRR